MNNSPCIGCGNLCTDEDMCQQWQNWFATSWERARLSLGIDPPKAKGRPMRHLYEVRNAMDGTVICRGSAADCAATIGCTEGNIRRASGNGATVKKWLRVTRLETGGEEGEADGMED